MALTVNLLQRVYVKNRPKLYNSLLCKGSNENGHVINETRKLRCNSKCSLS